MKECTAELLSHSLLIVQELRASKYYVHVEKIVLAQHSTATVKDQHHFLTATSLSVADSREKVSGQFHTSCTLLIWNLGQSRIEARRKTK